MTTRTVIYLEDDRQLMIAALRSTIHSLNLALAEIRERTASASMHPSVDDKTLLDGWIADWSMTVVAIESSIRNYERIASLLEESNLELFLLNPFRHGLY